MSIYAKIEKNIITNIIVCEDSQIVTQNGHHVKFTDLTREPKIGGSYNDELNKFIDPKPYESWNLNEELIWVAPDGLFEKEGYWWNESSKQWIALETSEE